MPPGRSCARTLAIRGGVAGVASEVTAFRRVCRPRLVLGQGVLLGPRAKRYARRRVVRVERRVIRGTEEAIATGLAATHTGTGLTTASSERRHATCRASLAPLVRRGRAIAHTEAVPILKVSNRER